MQQKRLYAFFLIGVSSTAKILIFCSSKTNTRTKKGK